MGDSFQGTGHIELYPGDANVPVWFKIPVASASTANDGAIPYGSTLASATVTMEAARGWTSSGLITSVTVSSQIVFVTLSHSSTFKTGIYTLKATISFSLAESVLTMTRPFRFNRVVLYED